MASLTICARNRLAEVSFLETTRALVTRGTKLVRWCRQHGWLGRSVRLVTSRALASHRSVDYCTFEITALVTASTEVSFGAGENRRVIGAVRVVAHGALLDVRMGVILAQAVLRLAVAVQAKLRLILLQPERADESMGPMTGGAVALRQGCVGIAHIDIDIFVTALACALILEAGTFSKLSHGGRGQQIEAKHDADCQGYEPGTGVCAVSHRQ